MDHFIIDLTRLGGLERPMPIATATAAAITFATAATAKKAIESVFTDIYGLSKGAISKRIAGWRASSAIDQLYLKLRAIRFVKTIWQVEKDVDLSKFYYPSRVIKEETRQLIADIDDFGGARNVVVLGTVGQGKSIFLRYLVSREMARGRVLPLFLELRRVEVGEDLLKYIKKSLDSLGIATDQHTLEFLLSTGRLMLFLDAYDEVKESQRSALAAAIQDLIIKYDKLRVFLTSRPGTGVEGLPGLDVFTLASLEGNEYQEVVHRMVHEKQSATAIIKGVEKQTGVKELLATPLLVALLVFRYRVDQSIPANSMAFYENLFGLLLQRHDKLKAGYVRPRRSRLSDGDLEEIFNAVCFLLRRDGVGALKRQALRTFVKESLGVLGITADADHFIADIVDITCLLLEEGGEFRFIHRSVCEFHAACFVRDQSEANAKEFYTALLRQWRAWRQEIEFLLEMDQYRCNKFFVLPDLVSALNDDAFDGMEVTCRFINGEPRLHSITHFEAGPWCVDRVFDMRFAGEIEAVLRSSDSIIPASGGQISIVVMAAKDDTHAERVVALAREATRPMIEAERKRIESRIAAIEDRKRVLSLSTRVQSQ